ncbi:amidohydrolase family protein [Spongiibacter sp. KMU-158]|uniref:Amidohydrolase family protein n=1 Tax=Spongiibacter pelagi TaxID=2760804 RepID=A0A927GVA3_9GAMM|nr:amidohydrolase family protein [Spongiibacter pelagi]MBD2858185.1 amidohydrolase family protein [Spongiibacter pelagi]
MIFDAHLHVIDPAFPLYSNDGYLPDPFTVEDYVGSTAALGIAGGAVVSGSFQCYDQSYLLAALDNLGPSFVGVTQLPSTISDSELLSLGESRIRAIRFNIRRGGADVLDNLREFACRVHDLLGWHSEVYADAKTLTEIEQDLCSLPALSIDHLGLSKDGLPTLYRLIEQGVKVKATGFGRVDFAVSQVLKRLYEINPDAMMFGTDLPSTRSPRPFNHSDLEIVQNALDDEGARKVLWENAANFYRLEL